ncbi:MAG: TldD/PmbA family protein [Rhodobacterales bacterium]|nr:TldD/PmbA family protein [Rhodobacterales bacterium]
MTQSLNDLTQALLAAARAAGADAADAVAVDGTSLSIEVRGGALEQAERSEGIDIGLRVMIGQRQANVSSSDTRPETLATMAERAVAMANEAPEDPYLGLADASQLAQNWDIGALELADPAAEPAPADLESDAREVESLTLAHDGITQIQSAAAAYSNTNIHIATSNGFSGGYTRTSRSLYCVAIAGTGSNMERDHDGDSRIFQSDLRSARDIADQTAQRTLDRMGARKPPTGTYPVLFDERISSSLIGHLLGAINGSAIARGASFLRDSLGQQVLPTTLSVLENPHRPRAVGSRAFDAEGLPTAPRAIIDNGTLTGWTLDLATARQLDMTPTANAARGTSSPPSPATWNIALTQSDQSRADLIADMGTGLLVTSLIGATINPNTGEYSRGAAGFWIENGEITHAVNECTIAGNLRDMLLRLNPANDARAHLSSVVPSILIEGMILAGE